MSEQMARQFYKNDEGVHLGGHRPDYTLCGIPLTGSPDDPFSEAWGMEPCQAIDVLPVTCPECVDIISLCCGVETLEATQ